MSESTDPRDAASVLDRLLKRSPWRYHHDRERWARRTYPCSRWWCFRRSPAWRSFERDGKSWCDRHVPLGGDLD